MDFLSYFLRKPRRPGTTKVKGGAIHQLAAEICGSMSAGLADLAKFSGQRYHNTHPVSATPKANAGISEHNHKLLDKAVGKHAVDFVTGKTKANYHSKEFLRGASSGRTRGKTIAIYLIAFTISNNKQIRTCHEIMTCHPSSCHRPVVIISTTSS